MFRVSQLSHFSHENLFVLANNVDETDDVKTSLAHRDLDDLNEELASLVQYKQGNCTVARFNKSVINY